VIVVVLDGARWQDVLVGVDPSLGTLAPSEVVPAERLMPTLHAMMSRGIVVGEPERGEPMQASGPNFISLPGYNEIFSGRTPAWCADNDCLPTQQTTIVDEVRARRGQAGVFSSWAPIARAAARSPGDVVLSTGMPGTEEFRPDHDTAVAGLAYLVRKEPQFLFLGLGEPDEFAHQGDYRGYLGSLQRADAILADLQLTLASMGDRGRRTSVFVTCDHGRGLDFRNHGAAWPESARVWLVAAGGSIPARGAVVSKTGHRLRDIAPSIRVLLGLPPDPSPDAGQPLLALLPRGLDDR
jgi:hypothetical protein